MPLNLNLIALAARSTSSPGQPSASQTARGLPSACRSAAPPHSAMAASVSQVGPHTGKECFSGRATFQPRPKGSKRTSHVTLLPPSSHPHSSTDSVDSAFHIYQEPDLFFFFFFFTTSTTGILNKHLLGDLLQLPRLVFLLPPSPPALAPQPVLSHAAGAVLLTPQEGHGCPARSFPDLRGSRSLPSPPDTSPRRCSSCSLHPRCTCRCSTHRVCLCLQAFACAVLLFWKVLPHTHLAYSPPSSFWSQLKCHLAERPFPTSLRFLCLLGRFPLSP